MPTHKEVDWVPYAPEQVFELVSDIRRYPEFIPWIKAMRVSREREEAGIGHARGEAIVAFHGFSESFTTDVASNPDAKTVDVALVRGPFRKLENNWTLTPERDGTKIEFFIRYEFSNPLLRMLAVANLGVAVSKIMGAYKKEAHRRYAA